jgi:hypothetical protein
MNGFWFCRYWTFDATLNGRNKIYSYQAFILQVLCYHHVPVNSLNKYTYRYFRFEIVPGIHMNHYRRILCPQIKLHLYILCTLQLHRSLIQR